MIRMKFQWTKYVHFLTDGRGLSSRVRSRYTPSTTRNRSSFFDRSVHDGTAGPIHRIVSATLLILFTGRTGVDFIYRCHLFYPGAPAGRRRRRCFTAFKRVYSVILYVYIYIRVVRRARAGAGV